MPRQVRRSRNLKRLHRPTYLRVSRDAQTRGFAPSPQLCHLRPTETRTRWVRWALGRVSQADASMGSVGTRGLRGFRPPKRLLSAANKRYRLDSELPSCRESMGFRHTLFRVIAFLNRLSQVRFLPGALGVNACGCSRSWRHQDSGRGLDQRLEHAHGLARPT